MTIFRSASGEGRAEVVLTAVNPYGSRELVVERDEDASVAYLRAPDGTVHGAVWLANHRAAPPVVDLARVNSGRPPLMPRPGTTHPAGRGPLGRLTVLWFEEGDGVALYEDDDLLAVIPGWADMSRGMPGYARDAVGESPFAWALSEALEGLAPRISNARSYWVWRHAEGSWPSFQQFAMGHIDAVLGRAGRYWDASGDRLPTVGITERPPREGRPFSVLSTVGMSCQRMPTVEQWIDQPDAYARIELAVATRDDPREAALLLVWLAQYPWHSVTWLGHGHTAKWYHEPATFPLGPRYAGVLMLADPPDMPDLSGFTFGGEAVRWLWLTPITAEELEEHRH
ncbi:MULTISPECIES: suppressor of fused domain protein [unclassified Nonomuraea]|uniref:suppressor of fused domain protein n=1 Tax=unclassified Nonomuraea TaxID=2593643 RepID=UPI0033F0B710